MENVIRKVAGSSLGWGNFLNLPNTSSRTRALGSTPEMGARNLPRGEKRPARRAENFTAICEPNVWNCGSLNLSQP
jgi:hypothetical protein